MIPNPFHRITGVSEIRLSSNDFRLLLDQLEKPALLLNLSRKIIVASNFAFTELTGFGADEIASSNIEKLIPEAELEKIADGAVMLLSITRKNQQTISTSIKTRFINQSEKLVLFTFDEDDAHSAERGAQPLTLINDLVSGMQGLFDTSLEELVQIILRTVKTAFQARYVIFYIQERKDSDPGKILGSDSIFPQQIPAIETRRLTQIDFWEPGKRVLSEIHRVGRTQYLPAVITIPVAIDEQKNGLLVVVPDNLKNRGDIEILLQPISNWLEALLKGHQIYQELSDTNRSNTEEIEQYSQFYENASDCALILDGENHILDCNKNTCDFLKYTRVELLGKKAEIIFENSAIQEKLVKKEFAFQKHEQEPVYIYDREGNRKPVAYQIIALEDRDSGRKLLVITDQTALKESEKKLQEFENKAALGDVIADFAHEVRNPMNSFVSGLQVMKKKTAADDSIRTTIEGMLDDCNRINGLMESVLSYSRQKVENFKDVDLELLLRRILNQNNSKFKQNRVEALFQLKAASAVVSADQRSLEQAFVNLINNAFDAIKQDGGVISLQIEAKGAENQFLEISISDTGPGIPPEIREKLFEPFVSSKPKGTGLGLAITKRMIEAHQGKIELETYPGGTIFRVILPNKAIIKGETA